LEERWPPGAHVALRSIWQGWVWFAFPAVVVFDTHLSLADDATWPGRGTCTSGSTG